MRVIYPSSLPHLLTIFPPWLVFFRPQMYIALISAHALGLSGMHFFTCIKVQWNGEFSLSYGINYNLYLSQKDKHRVSESQNESKIKLLSVVQEVVTT